MRMSEYTSVIERDPETRLYVGYVPGFPGAHSQGDTLEELNADLREVIAMLLEDGELEPTRKLTFTHELPDWQKRRKYRKCP